MLQHLVYIFSVLADWPHQSTMTVLARHLVDLDDGLSGYNPLFLRKSILDSILSCFLTDTFSVCLSHQPGKIKPLLRPSPRARPD